MAPVPGLDRGRALAQDGGMLDLRPHFSRFLGSDKDRLHFAAHSHHPWPDVTRDAQLAAWDLAASRIDGKWAEVLGPLWQRLQGRIAVLLNLPDPATLVFAPNTHEFVGRILSALPAGRVPRVLTTDGEFHSFARQAARLEEEGLLAVTRIPAEPAAECLPRLVEAARGGGYDLIWVSQVMYQTGAVLEGLEALAGAAGEAALVIDGYHAFMARPVDLSALAGRAFYLAGGYKYAMGGEGCCFLHCPPGWLPRPRLTGWYAAFAALAAPGGGTPYARDGQRFMGATFDPSGLFRLEASLGWAQAQGLDPQTIHAHARALQARFLERQEETLLAGAQLAVPGPVRGNFLAFELAEAGAWQARLAALGIVTDHRGQRLRLGFGLYQSEAELDALLRRLRRG